VEVLNLYLKDIVQNGNSRTDYKDNAMAMLMGSIKENGLLQPIGVRKKDDKYEVVFGNRRLIAITKLGWTRIPAIEFPFEDKESILSNLTENIARHDLNIFDTGKYLTYLHHEFNMSYAELAIRLGMTQSKVKTCMQLFEEVPAKYIPLIIDAGSGGKHRGNGKNIPMVLASKIVTTSKSLGMTKQELNNAFEFASKSQISSDKLTKIIPMALAEKISYEQASKRLDAYAIVRPSITLKRAEYNKLIAKCGSLKHVGGYLSSLITKELKGTK